MTALLLLLALHGCDGPKSEDDTAAADADGDGYPAGFDCDDDDADVNPGAAEVCDDGSVDEDCSGAANLDDPGLTDAVNAWTDADGDGMVTMRRRPSCVPSPAISRTLAATVTTRTRR